MAAPPGRQSPRRFASTPAQAQDQPINLKMSSWVPAQHPLNPSLQAWADDIKKASNGTITATLFPSEQLGKAFDHYDMARDGIADLTYINPGYQPGRFPIIAAGELPFLMSNAKGGSIALDAVLLRHGAPARAVKAQPIRWMKRPPSSSSAPGR